MLKKKIVYISSLIFIILFIAVLLIINSQLTKVDKSEVKARIESVKNLKTNVDIENEIRLEYLALKEKQKTSKFYDDKVISNFIKNVNSFEKSKNDDIESLWRRANDWISNNKFYDIYDKNLGNVIYNLKNSKITYAHVYSRGTQLKLLLSLEVS